MITTTKAKTEKTWVHVKPSEVEKLIVKFAKQGKQPSVVGMIMRDEYGIPDVKKLTGKSITKILEEANFKMAMPEDLRALVQKTLELRKHIESHPHDPAPHRSLLRTESEIRKLEKCYKAAKKLPPEWKYEPDRVKLLLH